MLTPNQMYLTKVYLFLAAGHVPLVAHTEALFATIEHFGLPESESERLRDDTIKLLADMEQMHLSNLSALGL